MPTVPWQTKPTVSFPLEDKHVVNEHHEIRKSYNATQEKLPSTDNVCLHNFANGVKFLRRKLLRETFFANSTAVSIL